MTSDRPKLPDTKYKFGISTLLGMTAVAALHLAFPVLLRALIATVLSGLLLGLMLFVFLYVVILLDTKTPFATVAWTNHPVVDRWSKYLGWSLVALYVAFLCLFGLASLSP